MDDVFFWIDFGEYFLGGFGLVFHFPLVIPVWTLPYFKVRLGLLFEWDAGGVPDISSSQPVQFSVASEVVAVVEGEHFPSLNALAIVFQRRFHYFYFIN